MTTPADQTGPPYPHPTFAPGSNSIGQFRIGVSPIGTISPFDPWATIISQYGNSPILDGIVTSFNDAIDQTQNFDSFYDNVWNLPTAVGWGLDVLGRIVGVSRTIPLPGNVTYFGFEESNSWVGFGQGGFYSGGGITPNYVLSDNDFRVLIVAKAAGNISDGSILTLNKILLTLFPNRGLCYVQDNQNMSLTFVFGFVLNVIELAIIQLSGVLPVPSGVVVSVQTP